MEGLVFISHASNDRAFAERVCTWLEESNVPCWIAPRDVKAGCEFPDEIDAAIESTRAVILIFSSAANESRHVRSEIRSAFDNSKTILPLRIENVLPAHGMNHLLGSVHWLSVNPNNDRDFQRKMDSVLSLIDLETDSFVPKRQLRLNFRALGCVASGVIAASLMLGYTAFTMMPGSEDQFAVKARELEEELRIGRLNNLQLEGELETTRAELALAGLENESLRQDYLLAFRANSEGTKLEELKTVDGETLKDVTIRSISDDRVAITHSAGLKSIPFKSLPESFLENYVNPPQIVETPEKREEPNRRDFRGNEQILASEKTDETERARRRKMAELKMQESQLSLQIAEMKVVELERRKSLADLKSRSSTGSIKASRSEVEKQISEREKAISLIQAKIGEIEAQVSLVREQRSKIPKQ